MNNLVLIFEKLFMGIISMERLKAPRGKVFEVTDIMYSADTTGAANVLVYRRDLPDEYDGVNPAPVTLGDIIAYFSEDVIQVMQYHYSEPIRTKFLTILKNFSAGQGHIVIIGRIVKASKSELIWEWFRRGAS